MQVFIFIGQSPAYDCWFQIIPVMCGLAQKWLRTNTLWSNKHR